jgi:hypothetical protein
MQSQLQSDFVTKSHKVCRLSTEKSGPLAKMGARRCCRRHFTFNLEFGRTGRDVFADLFLFTGQR